MIEIKTTLRKWGNSFGVIIPQKAIEKTGVAREGKEITIFITKEGNVLRETFGTVKFRKSTKKMMEEIDKELYYE